MSSTILFDVGIVMVCGLLFGRLAKLLKMPNVTGYLIAGLILGPCVLGIIPADMVTNFSVASDMALGFIAFSIGGEFKISYFKQVGMTPIIIAITESMGAVLFVMISCILLGFNLQLSILLGAIAAATAPAQTIMVIRQYRAKGPMTSMLMSVVALDDAVALIAFGFAATIVKSMNAHQAFHLTSVLMPFYEVLVSFAIGLALSFLMILCFRFFKKASNRLCAVVGFVFLASWLSDLVQGSALLTCMALGAGLANLFDDADQVFQQTETFTPPIYMLFFAMSGAGFDLGALRNIGMIGITYVIMRVAGKMFGAWFGGKVTKSDKKICKYLGPTLMPQAGVALGLILIAEAIVPEYGKEIRTIILCSTFIYSILGPSVAKWALAKAGEIILPERKKKKAV